MRVNHITQNTTKPLLSKLGQKIRTNLVLPHLIGNILELGCGISRIPSLLNQNQYYIGVDKNPIIIEWLRSKYPNQKFICSDIELNDLRTDVKFDTVLMLSLIEHLNNASNVFAKIEKKLSQIGKIVITTPTPFGGSVHKFGSYIGLFSLDAAIDHKFFYSLKSMTQLLENSNLILDEHQLFLFRLNQLFIITVKH